MCINDCFSHKIKIHQNRLAKTKVAKKAKIKARSALAKGI